MALGVPDHSHDRHRRSGINRRDRVLANDRTHKKDI